ncbi:hypothetical protein TNCV_382831, partial [Trichonephila clavipes]
HSNKSRFPHQTRTSTSYVLPPRHLLRHPVSQSVAAAYHQGFSHYHRQTFTLRLTEERPRSMSH